MQSLKLKQPKFFFSALFIFNLSFLNHATAQVPLVDVTATETLEALDPAFHLGYWLENEVSWDKNSQSPTTAELFKKSSKYQSFVQQIENDLKQVGTTLMTGVDGKGTADHSHQFQIRKPKDIPAGSTGFARNGAETSELELIGEGPRQLDTDWLKSPHSRFALIGIVNRVDRADFDRSNSSCGETRLLYRLSYEVPIDQFNPPDMVDAENPRAGKKKQPSVQGPLAVQSTLPFVLNLILKNPKIGTGGCADFIEKFWSPSAAQSQGTQLTEYFRNGLLNVQKSQLKFEQLEVNFQGLRFSAGYNPDFAGQALYFLRIFKLAEGKKTLKPVLLENTPNVGLLLKDEALREKFIKYIESNIAAIDEGTFVADPAVLGEQALDSLAISFSALGKVRRSNKPYSDFLKAANFRKNLFAETRFIKSAEGLIERLNNMTCMGCHQNGSTAGFHFLGAPSNKHNHFHNQTAIPFSPHYYAERFRRAKVLDQIKKGQQPDRFRFLSVVSHAGQSGQRFTSQIKEACTLTAFNKHFSLEMKCKEPEVECIATAEFVGDKTPTFFGECVPHHSSSSFISGMACMKASIEQSTGNRRDNKAAMDLLQKAKLPWNLLDFQDVAFSGAVTTGHQSNKVGFLNQQLSTFSAKAESNVVEKAGRKYSCGLPSAGVPLGRTSTDCIESKGDYEFTQIKESIDYSESKSLAELENSIQLAKKSESLPQQYCGLRGSIAFSKCSERLDGPLCFDRLGSSRSMIDICYAGHFCREDYICQSLPENVINQITKNGKAHGAPEDFLEKLPGKNLPPGQLRPQDIQLLRALRNQGVGFCTPTYFVLNMRVDGHPRPDGQMTGVHQNVKWPGKNPKLLDPKAKAEVMQWYRGGYQELNKAPYQGRHNRY